MSESQPKPRGRPPGFDRDAVLDALLVLFWERGYEAVSQQQMAAASGLSTSSLYNSFGTKARTFDAVLERYMDRTAAMLRPLEEGTEGLADLHRFADNLEHQIGGPLGAAGCLVATTMTSGVGREPRVAEVTAAHRARMRAAMRRALDRAQELGEPLPAPPEELAALLVATVLGIVATARATGAGDEARAQISALRDVLGGRPVAAVGPR